MPPAPQVPPPNILVVDDTSANLQLLAGMLRGCGYHVRPANSGEMALRAVESKAPDLILLDITMPGMDGYEVCRRLKADERWREIPIVFISSLSATKDKVRAFQAGGVDYLPRPFQLEEVDARVRTHLELRRQKQELQRSYARLQEMEQLRDTLTHMIAHDMRSPLLAIQMSINLLADSIPRGDADAVTLLETAGSNAARLVEMVSQMLDVSRLEQGKMPLRRENVDLVALAQASLGSLRPIAGARRLAVEGATPTNAFVDADLMRRVIGNLVGNAIKFTEPDGIVTVAIRDTDGQIRLEVVDNGAGIPPEKHQVVFQKFGQAAETHRHSGSGLGLTFCKMVVEAHGGAIGVESAPGRGSTFWVTLPAAAPAG